MVSIIDYGVGNLGSLLNIHKRVGIEAQITASPKKIKNSTHLILPGVGSFDNAMNRLHDSGIVPSLEDTVFEKKIPILGICLGMQMMTKKSEEGICDGLGWIDAKVKKFSLPKRMKIPHVGWNIVSIKNDNFLMKIDSQLRFYFVHSYYVKCYNEKNIIGVTNYGFDFVSSFKQKNIYGVQFHPEKSHNYGKELLKKFSDIKK